MHIFTHFCYWVTAIVLWLFLKPLNVGMIILLTVASVFCATGIYFFLRGYRYGLVVRGIRWLGHLPGLRLSGSCVTMAGPRVLANHPWQFLCGHDVGEYRER